MDAHHLPDGGGDGGGGRPFKGVLYAGLMLTEAGPKLIEYNVRFGDPECQVLLPRLKSDLLPALIAARDGVLRKVDLRWHDEAALCVVMAAKGYPDEPKRGSEIRGLDRGRRRSRGQDLPRRHAPRRRTRLVADGGRVLDIIALGRDLAEAQRRAYARGRPDRLARRLLPPRHRLPRRRAWHAAMTGSARRGRSG